MEMLKKIAMWLLIMVVALSLISFFLPSKMRVERSLVMKAPAANVYVQVNELRNWPNWNAWVMMDPNIQLSYEGLQSGTGASYSWVSEDRNIGSGKVTITESNADSIVTELIFGEHDKGWATYLFEDVEEGVKVTMIMNGDDVGMNPVGRYMNVMMGWVIGSNYEKSLKSMEEVAAKMPEIPAFKIELISISAQPVLTMRVQCSAKDIGMKLGECYGEIMKLMQEKGVNMAGQPFAIYHNYSEVENVDMEPCIPVDKAKVSTDKIMKGEIKAQTVVVADYYGPYEKSGMAHQAIDNWIAQNGKKISGSPWEQYITDPATEPDTSKWLTKVFYPVE